MKAVIDENLEEVLTKLGIWEDICENRVQCARCGQIIDTDNIGVFIPRRKDDGKRHLDFYCNQPDCINAILNS